MAKSKPREITREPTKTLEVRPAAETDNVKLSPSIVKSIAGIKKYEAGQRTLRMLIVSLAVVGVTWIVCSSIVNIFKNMGSDPAWTKVLSIFGAIILGTSGPAYLAFRVRGKLKSFIKTKSERIIALELSVDASRTSSGIQIDGTSEHD